MAGKAGPAAKTGSPGKNSGFGGQAKGASAQTAVHAQPSIPKPRGNVINGSVSSPAKLSHPSTIDPKMLIGKGDNDNSKFFGVSGLPAQSNPDL